MTIKEKQWQLYYLGYYGDTEKDIDGLWGAKSLAATKKFQADFKLTVDGVFGNMTFAKTKELITAVQKVVTNYVNPALSKSSYGLAGPMTVAATKAYQEHNGLPVTGRADEKTRASIEKLGNNSITKPTVVKPVTPEPPAVTQTPATQTNVTGTWWDKIKYFERSEFGCKCGRYCNKFPVEPSQQLIEIADDVREHFNAPMTVTSGIRCTIHNANSGGVSNSRHLSGKAMDFYVEGKTANQVLAHVQTIPGIRYSYAINDRCVHMDVQ